METVSSNLTLKQAASLLGISSHTLRTWMRQRRLAHVRMGRVLRFKESDVRAFEAACRVPARPGAAGAPRTH